uniref:Uncharacterized protein n=1 Tax=Chromera velia CCMP2878 TaxID=1169474 RepID=A0A0K6S988_9ALVE|eukprot:Cvel_27649.t1-p1 / transcript=Cvel_27649.t1 / gene=Cvel_27649 / organism=Chromera_velia_CCMP2878 / gene_product=hypothetical protein / transcript_product=hypothetical protein / location=Cvel_scaffold3482:1541-13821(-) / protein_length=976 / sequence_SO=supercontig / SO=protein_coding / is_pseudo=false
MDLTTCPKFAGKKEIVDFASQWGEFSNVHLQRKHFQSTEEWRSNIIVTLNKAGSDAQAFRRDVRRWRRKWVNPEDIVEKMKQEYSSTLLAMQLAVQEQWEIADPAKVIMIVNALTDDQRMKLVNSLRSKLPGLGGQLDLRQIDYATLKKELEWFVSFDRDAEIKARQRQSGGRKRAFKGQERRGRGSGGFRNQGNRQNAGSQLKAGHLELRSGVVHLQRGGQSECKEHVRVRVSLQQEDGMSAVIGNPRRAGPHGCRGGGDTGRGNFWGAGRWRRGVEPARPSRGLEQRLSGRDGCDANLASELQNAHFRDGVRGGEPFEDTGVVAEWALSNKTKNRLAHAYNGNTAVAGGQTQIDEVKRKITTVEEDIRTKKAKIAGLERALGITDDDPVGNLLHPQYTALNNQLTSLNNQLTELQKEKNLLLAQQQQVSASSASYFTEVDRKAFLDSGRDFVKSLCDATPRKVPKARGMEVLEGIKGGPGLPARGNVVVREVTKRFWEKCISEVQKGYRVCAVGSPGIGKSTSVAVLIKMLLERGETAVYLKRTLDTSRDGVCYEFKPMGSGRIETEVYTEEQAIRVEVASLKLPSTFFLIDPGSNQGSCDPSFRVEAKVIMNASPDSKHWGNEFDKRQQDGEAYGIFLYYPLWTLLELLAASGFLSPSGYLIEEDVLLERYREFGGTPRAVFAPESDLQGLRRKQKKGVHALTPEQVKLIADDKVAAVDTDDASQPKSSVMGYESEGPSYDGKPVIISKVVCERISERHMGLLWRDLELQSTHSTRGHLFEAYVRSLMLREGGNTFWSRKAVGARGDKTGTNLELPCCESIRLVHDVSAAVKACQKSGSVVYHSVNQQYELVDFVFKQNGTFFAVNATIAASDKAKTKKINKLFTDLGLKADSGPPKLKLLFAVPMERFNDFYTDPREPSEGTNHFEVRIIGVANPEDERGTKRSLPDASSGRKKRRRTQDSQSGAASSGSGS